MVRVRGVDGVVDPATRVPEAHHVLGVVPVGDVGTLETVAGQQFKFSKLAELTGLLYEVCGWIDSLPPTNKVGETEITCQEVGTVRYD